MRANASSPLLPFVVCKKELMVYVQKCIMHMHAHISITIMSSINFLRIIIYCRNQLHTSFNTIYSAYVFAFSVQQVGFQEMVSPLWYWWDNHFAQSPGTQVQLHQQMDLQKCYCKSRNHAFRLTPVAIFVNMVSFQAIQYISLVPRLSLCVNKN